VATEIEREHPAMDAQFRRDIIPPTSMCGAAMKQEKSALVWIPAPIQAMELQSLDFEKSSSRLRRSGSRLFVRHGDILAEERMPSIQELEKVKGYFAV
jgi:hypothetical protein